MTALAGKLFYGALFCFVLPLLLWIWATHVDIALPLPMPGVGWVVALFEAFYRGTVSIVAPIVATESLFGVVFSALLLGKLERVGLRLVLGAALVVTGGALIAVLL